MINSVNALEFLKPKLIKMDKFNSTTTTKVLPPTSLTQTRTFVAISGHHQHHYHHHNNSIDPQLQHQQFLLNDNEINVQKERVKVQHLENHTKLQNNKCWNNFRTLYSNISASSITTNSAVRDRETCKIRQIRDDHEIDVVNVEHLPINIVQQNESAFNLESNNNKYYKNNNNSNICENNIVNNNEEVSHATESSQRTDDQNSAYRHIESVHNYAKSKSYQNYDVDNQSPNSSRHSSYLDDDDDDDDDEDEDENNDIETVYGNDDQDIDYDERLENDDLDVDYENYFRRNRHKKFQKVSTSSNGALTIKPYNRISSTLGAFVAPRKPAQFVSSLKESKVQALKANYNYKSVNEDKEIHVDVDVETVESQSSMSPIIIPVLGTNSSAEVNSIGDESSAICSKPEHHARRPMNAFLIFCKRHRGIVKERYKNLENRAITKILGDWWASLDTSDKQCFTNLAQQNKDVFFSANPNFKWYKLPAPPLRTLTTRPTNAFGQEYLDESECSNTPDIISSNTRSGDSNNSNYFKLADEAQMGDLSQLMQDKSRANTKECAELQEALGETSQFMSAHIPSNAESNEENSLKRRFHNENSFSSNSSEEDGLEPKKKSARSCKGKRYQELINSGQIATAIKKSKHCLIRSPTGVGGGEHLELNNVKQNFANVNNLNNHSNGNVYQTRSISECENATTYDMNGFDLEERIKELPALNLDDYLQRKRNIKKKKKFSSNGKKRGQRSNNSGNNSNNNGNLIIETANEQQQALLSKYQPQIATTVAAAAVGSQKRKARKESITRRDVSAIEQEVASLLPLTINGCCYFQEAPAAAKYIKAIEKDTDAISATTQSNVTLTPPIIPLQQQATSLSSVSVNSLNNNNNTLNDNISSSTSDLLILAEVAANRTELKH